MEQEKKIKAIIFDLDNTLHDTEFLGERALPQAISAMIDNGMNCNLDEGISKMKEIIKEDPSNKFFKLASSFNSEVDEIVRAGLGKYTNPEINELKIFPDAKDVLDNLSKNFRLALLSQGSSESQNRRVDVLGVRDYFEKIVVNELGKKSEGMGELLEHFGFEPHEILVVGDRIDNEIKIANQFGMKTVRIFKGKYCRLIPESSIERPDYVINELSELYEILGVFKKKKFKVVAIGGGTGLPAVAEGLRKYTDDINLIVTVTDSGRSSGVLREELNLLPPGDIRNCLIALSNSEKLMCDLFQHRFDNGSLNGHSFGNLLLAALTKVTGSFENAIEEASRILKLKGRVLPSTLNDVHICAELIDGTILREENNIIDRNNGEVHLRSPIKRVFLDNIAIANKHALEEIGNADLIVICPGSLYTSVISNLLVNGINEAINNSKAKKVYISNIVSQVSQTYNYKASDHVRRILDYLEGSLDYVVLNNKMPNQELIESYEVENAQIVENDISEIEKLGINVIAQDILDDVKEKKILWEKKNLLRHDPDKLAKVLINLL